MYARKLKINHSASYILPYFVFCVTSIFMVVLLFLWFTWEAVYFICEVKSLYYIFKFHIIVWFTTVPMFKISHICFLVLGALPWKLHNVSKCLLQIMILCIFCIHIMFQHLFINKAYIFFPTFNLIAAVYVAGFKIVR